MATRLVGGILIGGRGRRLGGPKHTRTLGGASYLARVVAALAPHVDEVIAMGSGGTASDVAPLRYTSDAEGLVGPLAGLIGALRTEPDATWLVAACDLPLLTPSVFAWLLSVPLGPGITAVVPRTPDGFQPLVARYEPGAVGLLEAVAARGRRGPIAIVDDPQVATPAVPPALVSAFTNINTPADLADLEARFDVRG